MKEQYLYNVEYLEGLTREQLINLMKSHDFEKGFKSFSKNELIEQLSNIIHT